MESSLGSRKVFIQENSVNLFRGCGIVFGPFLHREFTSYLKQIFQMVRWCSSVMRCDSFTNVSSFYSVVHEFSDVFYCSEVFPFPGRWLEVISRSMLLFRSFEPLPASLVKKGAFLSLDVTKIALRHTLIKLDVSKVLTFLKFCSESRSVQSLLF